MSINVTQIVRTGSPEGWILLLYWVFYSVIVKKVFQEK